MAAHAAVPARRRVSTNGWGLPVATGVLYGLYAEVNARDGGALSWGQFWLGLISAVVLAVALYALRRYGRALPREARAAAWGALAGIAVGFLYSVTGASIYSSVVLGVIVGLVTAGAAFYLFYTHEDAAGHPAPW
ncbi:hypothetical protein GCM10010275_10480 [Streptomyces litmocidini]|uniref:hypothetical protein n=1 Tax=Streptomyces litmocidini TaxID=67318 RepID=UPI00167DAF45|nr:hypothetical protein [Streptomyces litmocidini]GGU77748.1 hypothetical protein GCM10010275_10480 [Streptomyces litmocidini]